MTTLLAVKREERLAWLRELAQRPSDGACVDWPWNLSSSGYPQSMRFPGGLVPVTHLLMEILGNPRPPGLSILHSCDRPPCLAPWHLRWGTHIENMIDRQVRGRASGARGENHPRAKLTWTKVAQIRAAVDAGESMRSQARIHGVSEATIAQVIHHETWVKMA